MIFTKKSPIFAKTGSKDRNKIYMVILAVIIALYLLIIGVLGFIWDFEPDSFDVVKLAEKHAKSSDQLTAGVYTTVTLIHIAETLLDKPGGFLSNDISPPGVFMDNIPRWEYGVLVQIRDMVRIMRNDFSRSQSQSQENPDLVVAEGRFFFDNSSWVLPASENEYAEGIERLKDYWAQLSDPDAINSRFYARSDNLVAWLDTVTTRLGSLSQRLSASVGKKQLDLALSGDAGAQESIINESEQDRFEKTPWLKIDDVIYEARGQAWALIHLLRAVEKDFEEVLKKKNALVSLRQLIRELDGSQMPINSPVVLNGSGFGIVANHSLVMASYLSRANAAIIDLRNLLQDG